MRNFHRQKIIYCGDRYREVDIFPYTEEQNIAAKRGKKRSKRKKETPPKQKNLNDKNARRYIVQLGNLNFTEKDLHITCTYANDHLPATIEEAERIISNFIRRIQRRRKKDGLSALRYILVSAYGIDRKGELHRIHHHIIMDGALDRLIVKDLWRERRRKGETEGRKYGRIKADELEPDENGIAGLCNYFTKHMGGKKRWSCSQNLKKPTSSTDDKRYSRRQVERLCKAPVDLAYWEKQYPGWTLTDEDNGIEAVYNDITGWSIYLRFRRKE